MTILSGKLSGLNRCVEVCAAGAHAIRVHRGDGDDVPHGFCFHQPCLARQYEHQTSSTVLVNTVNTFLIWVVSPHQQWKVRYFFFWGEANS